MMTLAEVANSIQGARLQGPQDLVFSEICTDTRNIAKNSLFVALRGERFDAHDFIDQALDLGAIAVISEQPLAPSIPHVLVNDTRTALGDIARWWRGQFKLPVICVTGSNGKTTVTQMLASILEAASGEERRLSTRGNLNNDIGLPMTLFRLNDSHERAVLELGMNHPGEIQYLAKIAQPTVVLVNNAQREHQEFMGTVEATAHENGAAISELPSDGFAVFPADDDCASIWRTLANGHEIYDFGFHSPARIKATWEATQNGLSLFLDTPEGSLSAMLAIAGAHNAHNAAAAASAALAAGVTLKDIALGLERFRPVAGRGVLLKSPSGATLIDDTYNANPDSVLAAIDLLAARAHPRYLVLGDMGEVGEKGVEFHLEVGAYARSKGLDGLFTHGALAQHATEGFNHANAQHFESMEALIEASRTLAHQDSTWLIKGSRFMKMERVIEAMSGVATHSH
jgi:UDP-N-acetylmuramoyl-tripeptide--D-alanyl-D-alanine ligase